MCGLAGVFPGRHCRCRSGLEGPVYWLLSWLLLGRFLGGVRRCVFFFSGRHLGSASAASTKIPLLRARFQRAIGLGRGISRSAPPGAICVLPSGTAGSMACFFWVKSAMLCHIFVGPASPTPTPMCPSRDFGRKYFGAGPGAQNPRFQGAAERGGGQNRRTNPNKRVPRHN